MNQTNPYAAINLTPAALAAAEERATFLRKTYLLLLAGVATFAATLWAAGNVEPVRGWASSLGRLIYGNQLGWLLYMGLFIGGGIAVHAVAEKRPINLVAFFGYTFLLGLLLAPLILFIAARQDGGAIIDQAALMTTVVFGGLTAYVMISGKDFSFLRGALWIGMLALLAVGLCGMLFGFSLGFWFSAAAVVLFAGYILYDTSNVLHHYPTTAHVSAAVVLFTDVVLLFKHLAILLSNRD
jgi:FtsH-binding integral membrane protein